MFAFVGDSKCFLWRIILADDDKVFFYVFDCDSPVIGLTCCMDSPVGVGQIPLCTPKLLSNSLMISVVRKKVVKDL